MFVFSERPFEILRILQGEMLNEHNVRVLHRILIIRNTLVRFSEDFSEIIAANKLGYNILSKFN